MENEILKAREYLLKDLTLKPLLESISIDEIKNTNHSYTPFYYLCSSIISQQLSSKVSEVIKGRFNKIFHQKIPAPSDVIKVSIDDLRKVGLSMKKAEYVLNTAKYFLETPSIVENLNDEMSNEEIIKSLTQIKGIGVWTVEMLLMFGLGRINVFSVNDYALYTSVKILYGVEKNDKKLEKKEILEIAEKWSPYKTIASKFLWIWYGNRQKK